MKQRLHPVLFILSLTSIGCSGVSPPRQMDFTSDGGVIVETEVLGHEYTLAPAGPASERYRNVRRGQAIVELQSIEKPLATALTNRSGEGFLLVAGTAEGGSVAAVEAFRMCRIPGRAPSIPEAEWATEPMNSAVEAVGKVLARAPEVSPMSVTWDRETDILYLLDEPTRRIVAARKGGESWIAADPQRFPELRKVEWIVIWPRGRGLAGRLIGWTYNPDGRHCVVNPDELYYEFVDFLGGGRIDVVESHRVWKWIRASGK